MANNKTRVEIFDILFERSLLKVSFVIASVLFSILNVFLLYGIIWFERFGSDHKRTIMNKLLTSVCWILIFVIFWYFAKKLTCKSQLSKTNLKLLLPVQLKLSNHLDYKLN